MQVEQAIFTSAQTQDNQGYHVVAASPGIDNKLAQALAMWSPSQNGLIDTEIHAESLNCFPLAEDSFGVSRTVYGGAEYSDRGEFRLETNVLVMRQSQLAGYHHNPLTIARVARAAGYLRLRTEMPQQLSAIELPNEICIPETSSEATPELAAVVAEVAAMCLERRVVVVGVDDAMEFVARVIGSLPTPLRSQLSFTTGLKPSVHRPFSLQFLPGVNDDLVRELAAREMTCVMAQPDLVSAGSE